MLRKPLGSIGELLVGLIVFLLASLVAWGVVGGFFSLSHTIKPAAISHEQDLAYNAVVEPWRSPWPFEVRFDSSDDPTRSRAVLREDGVLLQPPHSVHADIRAKGHGRFSHWGGDRAFYFSASDNSDPRANGRRYSVNVPAQLPEWMLLVAFGLYAYAGWLLWRASEPLTQRFGAAERRRAYLMFSIVVFVVLFVAGRLWFFVDVPVPEISPDSASYYAVAESIARGELPTFGGYPRPPLYPLLMAATFSVSDSVMALVYVQTAISCIAGILLIYSVHGLVSWSALPLAIVMAGFFADVDAFAHDTAMMTESLYTSLLIIAFALLMRAFSAKRPSPHLAGASLCMALVIYTKPAGLYLMVIYVLILSYLAYRRMPGRCLLAFAMPFPIALAALASYNKVTANAFALAVSDGIEITLVTNLFWETDPSYPEEINQAIESARRSTASRITPDEQELLNNSWDLNLLHRLYLAGHYYGPQTEIAKVTDGWGSPEWRDWLLKLSRDAIRKHPDRFLKHYCVMMYHYYYTAVKHDSDLRAYLRYRIYAFYVERYFSSRRDPLNARMAKEFSEPGKPPSTVTIKSLNVSDPKDLSEMIVLRETPLTTAYLSLHGSFKKILSSAWWSVGHLAVLFAALGVLAFRRLNHDGAFLLLILALSVLGSASIVSLVEYSMSRYSYPLEWTYYVTVIGVVLLGGAKANLLDRAKGGADGPPSKLTDVQASSALQRG